MAEQGNRNVGARPDGTNRRPEMLALDRAQGLTEDLQKVARSLANPAVARDRKVLRMQSAALMPLAEAVEATRLFLLAEELYDRAGDLRCAQFATPLAEMRTLLHQLILSVQATRNAWLIRP